ncbi:unnamed protein product [Amaranthus hypochondriacus]
MMKNTSSSDDARNALKMSMSIYGSDASDTPSASSDAPNALKLPKSVSPGGSGSRGSDARYGYMISRYKDEFEELAMLGEGVFGKVFRCRNKLDEKEYAIKVIPFSSQEQEKILLEVKIHSKMCHPNVVTYHQAWIEDRPSVSPASSKGDSEGGSSSSNPTIDKTLYIVLELCIGTLENDVCRSMNSTWKTIYEVCNGLEHIHSKGVIHRDLTIQNIFVDQNKVVKIGDFGIARFCNKDGFVHLSENSGHGALTYGVQEMLADTPFAVKATDVYSLAVVAFNIFYGDADKSGVIEATKSFIKHRTFPTSWYVGSLSNILLDMISINPTDRPCLRNFKNLLEEHANKHPNKKRKCDCWLAA